MTESLSTKIASNGADKLLVSPRFEKFSRVVVKVDDETSYTSGNGSGRTLTIENPFGTQKMADNILQKVAGYSYQPYSASKVFIDPAAELGDGIAIGSVYGGVSRLEAVFGRAYAVNVSAPAEREIDHEIPVRVKSQRVLDRKLSALHGAVGGIGGRLSDLEEEYGEDRETIFANFGDVNASIDLLASNQEDMQTAQITLSARLGAAEASLELKASKDTVTGLSKTVATLSADFIKLQGRVTVDKGSLRINGSLYCTGANTSFLNHVVSSDIQVGTTLFATAKQITSTDGTAYSVLAQ